MTILVVDDETAIAETLADVLEAAGYRAVSARDGREGLERFEETKPGLVITDIMMPHVDGREMVRAIRRTEAHRAALRVAEGSDLFHHQSAADERRRP